MGVRWQERSGEVFCVPPSAAATHPPGVCEAHPPPAGRRRDALSVANSSRPADGAARQRA